MNLGGFYWSRLYECCLTLRIWRPHLYHVLKTNVCRGTECARSLFLWRVQCMRVLIDHKGVLPGSELGSTCTTLLFGPVKFVDWHIQRRVLGNNPKYLGLVRLLLRQSVLLHGSGGERPSASVRSKCKCMESLTGLALVSIFFSHTWTVFKIYPAFIFANYFKKLDISVHMTVETIMHLRPLATTALKHTSPCSM